MEREALIGSPRRNLTPLPLPRYTTSMGGRTGAARAFLLKGNSIEFAASKKKKKYSAEITAILQLSCSYRTHTVPYSTGTCRYWYEPLCSSDGDVRILLIISIACIVPYPPTSSISILKWHAGDHPIDFTDQVVGCMFFFGTVLVCTVLY